MKEVVHIPTLDLAKEVLRVAKEQGFRIPTLEVEYYFKIEGNLLCVGFYKDHYSFASKDFYEKEGYSIIAAEEFLSRYKPKFKPIAMKCSNDQFEAVFLQHCGNVEEEPTELEQLRKENAELKEQLKDIHDQPKAGDVCLFWDDEADYAALMYYDKESVSMYDNHLKATPENIEKVIKGIKLN